MFEDLIVRSNRILNGASKAQIFGNLLIKCNFDLSNVGENDIKGDIYISAKTQKLFVALSLDTVVASDGSRIISDGGGSRVIEETSSLLLDAG